MTIQKKKWGGGGVGLGLGGLGGCDLRIKVFGKIHQKKFFFGGVGVGGWGVGLVGWGQGGCE